MASDLEAQMVSIERLDEYIQLQPEAPFKIPERDPPCTWPEHGEIIMQDVFLRYRPGLPYVLNGINVRIAPNEKVGIVGRTGAGKSSIIIALLRLCEIEKGIILIDGVDISKIGLNSLRTKVTVIPQDPVLFSGTVRKNLDPFGNYSDIQVWDSLRRAQLESLVHSLSENVEENGANFSVGQRQLLCIARALLAAPKIILMDEATAAVDIKTDFLIQQSIRKEFANCTCLTIAHRLSTILDSDKVLVMDQGTAVEFDAPKKLAANHTSLFFALLQNYESSVL